MALNKNELVAMFQEASVGYNKSFIDGILKPTGRGGVYAARDYIHANCVLTTLSQYGIKKNSLEREEDLKKVLPKAVMFRLNAYTPCLAYRYDELKKPAQDKLFDKDNYLFTEKQNGCRGWLIHAEGKWYLFSRNYSDVNCSLLDYMQNIYQFPTIPDEEIFAVDVEIKYEPDGDLIEKLREFGMETESKLEAMSALLQTRPETATEIQRKYKEKTGKDLITFRLIYPLYFKGRNYLKRKLGEGHAIYNEVIKYANQHNLNLQEILRCKGNREKKEVFLNSLLEAGSEGVVVHNLLSMYNTSENRDRDCFIKIKRSVGKSQQSGMGDTIEGWVSGFKMSDEGAGNAGLIGSLEVSIYELGSDGVQREKVIAYVPNLTQEMKKEITIDNGDGTYSMVEHMYDVVVEMDGQAISRKSRRLTHPRLLRMRFDKSKFECIYTEEWLNSQMDNYK